MLPVFGFVPFRQEKRPLLYLRFWPGIRRFDLEHETKSVFCRNAPWECFEETVGTFMAITRLLSKLDQTSLNKTVPWCNSTKILPSLERMLKLN